jgi:hypothetical protein
LDANTDNTYGDVTNKTNRAACLCHFLSCGGYNDWFLPSKDELNLMYTNLHCQTPPVGGFTGGYYWSSSENNIRDSNRAWDQYFSTGEEYVDCKDSKLCVRAVGLLTIF